MPSQEAIRDAITRRHHPPIPAPSRVESHQAKQLHMKATIIARLSILILSKTRIMDPYFQYFSSDSSRITITIVSN
jgi:hypothetical protein